MLSSSSQMGLEAREQSYNDCSLKLESSLQTPWKLGCHSSDSDDDEVFFGEDQDILRVFLEMEYF